MASGPCVPLQPPLPPWTPPLNCHFLENFHFRKVLFPENLLSLFPPREPSCWLFPLPRMPFLWVGGSPRGDFTLRGYLTMSRGISGFRDLVQRWGGGCSSSPHRAQDAPTAESSPAPMSTVPRQGNSAPGLSSTRSSSFQPLLEGHLFSQALQTILQKRGTSHHPRSHHTALLSSQPPLSLSEIILLIYFYLMSVFPLLGHPGGFHSH